MEEGIISTLFFLFVDSIDSTTVYFSSGILLKSKIYLSARLVLY